ncbi:TPA: EexN family lipoprotein [Yersinia enterocolitica]|nr:EexN family lipoprotein [Yersinia enterocolitica]
MKKFILAVCVLPVFLLTACDKTYTVDYFEKNPDFRAEFNKKCHNGENDPESLNCRNAAKSAQAHVFDKDFKG